MKTMKILYKTRWIFQVLTQYNRWWNRALYQGTLGRIRERGYLRWASKMCRSSFFPFPSFSFLVKVSLEWKSMTGTKSKAESLWGWLCTTIAKSRSYHGDRRADEAGSQVGAMMQGPVDSSKKKKNLRVVQRYFIYFFRPQYMRQNNCFGSNMHNELKRETIVLISTNQHFNYLKNSKNTIILPRCQVPYPSPPHTSVYLCCDPYFSNLRR